MPVDPAVTRRFVESLSTHLEDHLASWKSSLVDARREVDAILTAMGEKIPAQAKPLFPEDIVELILEDAIPPTPPPQRIVEKVVEKVVERVEVEVKVPGLPDWASVRTALTSIEAARTQVDVLTRFLAQANGYASRVCLLVLRNDRLTGWKAMGFDASGGRDEAARTIDLGADDDPFLGEVLKKERPMLAEPPPEGGRFRQALGGRPASRTFVVPMVIRDRVAGLLVADELEDAASNLNEAALEVLTFATGLTVDLLAARKKIPSPSLTPNGEEILRYQTSAAPFPSMDIGATTRLSALPSPPPAPAPVPPPAPPAPEPRRVAPPAPAPAPAPRPAPPPSPALAELADLAPKSKITDAGQALRALEESAAHRKTGTGIQVGPAKAPLPPPRPADLGLTTAIPASSAKMPPPAPASAAPPPSGGGELTMAFEHMKSPMAGVTPPAPPARPAVPMPPPFVVPPPQPAPPPAAPAAAVGGLADLAGGGSAPLAAPAGFVPRAMRAKAMDESQLAAEDAKRLARLLVSEIKLYNEKKVEEGRKNNDLYSRLKDDIDRSRQVFEERTPEAVRKGTSFFHDELVRILADGRPEAMGPS